MTYSEQRQQIRNEAFNKIREFYNPKCKYQYDPYDNSSVSEQREDRIRYIVSVMENKLKELHEEYARVAERQRQQV